MYTVVGIGEFRTKGSNGKYKNAVENKAGGYTGNAIRIHLDSDTDGYLMTKGL
jgi:hypothetical protein